MKICFCKYAAFGAIALAAVVAGPRADAWPWSTPAKPIHPKAVNTASAARIEQGAATQGSITLTCLPGDQSAAFQMQRQIGPDFQIPTLVDLRREVPFAFAINDGRKMREINIPFAPGAHRYNIDGATLVIERQSMTEVAPGSHRWTNQAGKYHSGEMQYSSMYDNKLVNTTVYWVASTGQQEGFVPPDDVKPVFARYVPGGARAKTETWQISPIARPTKLQVTAVLLDAKGHPTSGPVTLRSMKAGNAVVAALPVTYNSQSIKMQINAVYRGSRTEKASWVVGNIPSTVRNLPADAKPNTGFSFNGGRVDAVAVESRDLSGMHFGDNDRNLNKRMSGQWELQPPQNVDSHDLTGVPAIRCVIRAINQSSTFWDREVIIDNMKSTWAGSAGQAGAHAVARFPITRTGGQSPKAAGLDTQIGGAYPGQSQMVQIDGSIATYARSSENFTINSAKTRPGSMGVDDIVFDAPQTVALPSGIQIVTLIPAYAAEEHQIGNAEEPSGPAPRMQLAAHNYPYGYRPPGLWNPSPGPSNPMGQFRATLYVAIKAPKNIAVQMGYSMMGGNADKAASMSARPPVTSEWTYRPVNWQDLWVVGQPHYVRKPGTHGHRPASPLDSLMHQGYMPFSITLSGLRPLKDGDKLPPLTMAMNIRSTQKMTPFHLIVPVHSSLPKGWSGDEYDGKQMTVGNSNR